MLNALKRLDKKFLIFVGGIVCLPVLIIVVLAIIQGCGNLKTTHSQYEKKMISALESYIKKENKVPIAEGELVTVNLSTLVEKGYINSSDKLLNDSTCEGNVSVRRNGASIDENNGGYLDYTVSLECDGYSTVTLNNKIKENLVTEDSGLYQDGQSYIFKGDKVNNYIEFYGNMYRIISIDEDGIIRLIKDSSEKVERCWDNKFNVETNSYSGLNYYKDSKIIDYLIEVYLNNKRISEKAKAKIVAHDVCVGKRSSTDYSINSSIDCAEVLENQIISILNISDYAKASLDKNCIDLKSRSCNNYNYLKDVISTTWTSNSVTDNTHDVLYLKSGIVQINDARDYEKFNVVIYIDGSTLYTSGDGSLNNPYIIE